jgi:hypothetical protein
MSIIGKHDDIRSVNIKRAAAWRRRSPDVDNVVADRKDRGACLAAALRAEDVGPALAGDGYGGKKRFSGRTCRTIARIDGEMPAAPRCRTAAA